MGAPGRIDAHRALRAAQLLAPDRPFRVEVRGRLLFHPRGKALVQPDAVPPLHGHQVAEPLVRHLVRGGDVDSTPVGFGGQLRVDEQHALEAEDRAPVLHCAEEGVAAGARDQVELGQRVAHAEIVVVVGQHLRRRIEREACLGGQPARHDHAHVDALDRAVHALEVAAGKEQQVAAHARRLCACLLQCTTGNPHSTNTGCHTPGGRHRQEKSRENGQDGRRRG